MFKHVLLNPFDKVDQIAAHPSANSETLELLSPQVWREQEGDITISKLSTPYLAFQASCDRLDEVVMMLNGALGNENFESIFLH